MKRIFLLICLIFITNQTLFSQTGILTGVVVKSSDNQPVSLADVILENTNYFATTDENGFFKIDGIKPGTYNVLVKLIGFEEERLTEITIGSVRTQNIEIILQENIAQLDEVLVKTSAFRRKIESPLSVNKVGATEIMRSPGANRDISFVIRNLPGVATTNSFRNDLIVRGGAPSENKFFMDGIEIPNINHFATQGSTGGPVGMVNVNFIQNVEFYTGSFPASRGNALSSVMEISTKNPNPDKLTGSVTLGSSDFGLTLDTPTGKKSGMMFSVRRSYLQFLFEQLKLPFLPIYNDFQYAHQIEINDKNKLKIIGLGAIDNFKLNTKVNDGVTDTEVLDRNTYLLNNIPKYEQWNYTIGINWKHFTDKGYHELVLSRNKLNNTSQKYLYNNESPSNLLMDYQSQEIENKIRFQHNQTVGNWKWYTGIGVERVKYTNSTFQKINIGNTIQTVDFNSELTFQKYALFAQANRTFLSDKIETSISLRTDFSDYSKEMSNPFSQISPRLAIGFNTDEKNKFILSLGKYFQLPAYTIMGYRNATGTLINKENNVKYLNVWHFVTGYQWTPKEFFQLKVESFYKIYQNYPFDLNKGVSLANLGSDFGVIGNSPVNSSSKGRSYGIELSGTQKLSKQIFGSFSYTFVRSEFNNGSGKYVVSSWDNIHILNVVGGYKMKKNWEIGTKFRLLGGAPYTPIDENLSTLKSIWNINQQGILDYNRLNENRLPLYHSLDLRIDKKWYFNKWALNLYLDVQNAYVSKITNPDYLNVLYDNNGLPLTSETNTDAYQYKMIKNESGNILPSIGLMVDF